MLKIASLLGVGPQIGALFGFDLIIFKECIEFCMEKCHPLLFMDKLMVDTLWNKLVMMHSLGIVH